VLGDTGKLVYKRDQSGQPVVTRARPEVLAELARDMGGEVLAITDREIEIRVAETVERLRTREVEANRTVQRVERFPIFMIAAAVLLAAGFAASPWRRVAVACLALVLVCGAAAAQQTSAAGSEPAARDVDGGDEVAAEDREVSPAWWQRLLPGGSRRLARSGAAHWREGEVAEAGTDFAGAAALDPDHPDRLFDLGTALVATGQLEQGMPVMEQAVEAGARRAAYNAGTGALLAGDAEPAVHWLRQAVLADPDDSAAKRNYELALRLLQQQQQQQDEQDQENEENEDNQEQQEQQQDQDQQPTPTPSPALQSGAQPTPTPTPDPNSAVWAALEQAESEARDEMRSPTPQAVEVEKDW
jgi:tetratricopeptide (TPR) repeat protein